jgi:hypothetical protein
VALAAGLAVGYVTHRLIGGRANGAISAALASIGAASVNGSDTAAALAAYYATDPGWASLHDAPPPDATAPPGFVTP